MAHTFVLVHGSWHGGWCWSKVASRLAAAGHRVLCPTFTGLGERSHLLTRHVDLELHARDLIACLEWEDVTAGILVGHSYGGLPAGIAAARLPHRVRRLIYLDAFMPRDGASIFDLCPPVAVLFDERGQPAGDSWYVPAPPPEQCGVTDAADSRWVAARLTAMPIATHSQRAHVDSARLASIDAAYVRCLGFPLFAPFAASARDLGLQCVDLDCAHDAMITAPEAVARTLLDLADRGASVQTGFRRTMESHLR